MYFVILANPPVPVARAHPPPHRLAMARVLDEGGSVGALPAPDGGGDVTFRFDKLLPRHRLYHLQPVMFRPAYIPAPVPADEGRWRGL